MQTPSKVIVSFLTGLAVGTTLGILLAPEKGEETRSKIKDKFEDLTEKAKGVYGKFKNRNQPVEDEE